MLVSFKKVFPVTFSRDFLSDYWLTDGRYCFGLLSDVVWQEEVSKTMKRNTPTAGMSQFVAAWYKYPPFTLVYQTLTGCTESPLWPCYRTHMHLTRGWGNNLDTEYYHWGFSAVLYTLKTVILNWSVELIHLHKHNQQYSLTILYY